MISRSSLKAPDVTEKLRGLKDFRGFYVRTLTANLNENRFFASNSGKNGVKHPGTQLLSLGLTRYRGYEIVWPFGRP
jgi:hypothetical protein